MPKAALNGISIAGGPVEASATKTKIEGIEPARLNDTVGAHGDSPLRAPSVLPSAAAAAATASLLPPESHVSGVLEHRFAFPVSIFTRNPQRYT